ncbi:hypothetical protein EMGBD3_05670 [Nitrosarchaeum sp.]|nr:hypothetical protein EMGBD3_05670 [Nitrosarchaeum sp.]
MAKNKSLKGLGARYGIKIRKQYTKIHFQLKEKRTCLNVVLNSSLETQLAFGLVRNVVSKLLDSI